ncbi:MAG: nucleotidyltransferase domain-containing protein [Thermodesulfobacteriota bacterium]
MEENERQIADEIKRRLPDWVRKHLRRMILFGSRARGGSAEDSDLDLVALVDDRTPALERAMDDAVYSVMWDRDFKPTISLKVFAEDRFNAAVARGYSFYRNVMREGIVL